MAQAEKVELISDLDGTEAGETVSFGLDGTAYEIDLSDEQALAMRAELSPYIAVASRRHKASRRRRARGSSAEPPGLREWAASRGVEVRDGSGVPGRVRQEFELLVKLGVVRAAEA
jgi:hypothetical protein